MANSGLLVAVTAMLAVLTAIALIAVALVGVLVSQLTDLKAYVRTVISMLEPTAPFMSLPPATATSLTPEEVQQKWIEAQEK